MGSVYIRAEKFDAGFPCEFTRVCQMTMEFGMKNGSMKKCVIVIPLTDSSKKVHGKKLCK